MQHNGNHTAEKYFYLHDCLGSVREIIKANGSVVKHYIYGPFGQTIQKSGTLTNPFMFTGQYYDSEISQYYLRARQYDPQLMRFTSRDPKGGMFQEPFSFHRYLYCANDPIDRVDLNGAYWDGPWWLQEEFWTKEVWSDIGSELLKGLAATADGAWFIPFHNPLEGVYANPDGSVDSIYYSSRLLGSIGRSALMLALNVNGADMIWQTGGPAVSQLPSVGARLLSGMLWKPVFLGGNVAETLGSGVGLAWSGATALLSVASVQDSWTDILNVLTL